MDYNELFYTLYIGKIMLAEKIALNTTILIKQNCICQWRVQRLQNYVTYSIHYQ